MMEGRRYSEGLHQALEAKEKVQPSSRKTRRWPRSPTRTTSALRQARRDDRHGNDRGGRIPRHLRPRRGRNSDQHAGRRIDGDDQVYRTGEEKIRRDHRADRGLPGARPAGSGRHTSIEKSELLLPRCSRKQIDFNDPAAFRALYQADAKKGRDKLFAVLNARYHEQEAAIIAQAGVPGAVTIATNMAGRGTDIQLGGNLDMR